MAAYIQVQARPASVLPSADDVREIADKHARALMVYADCGKHYHCSGLSHCLSACKAFRSRKDQLRNELDVDLDLAGVVLHRRIDVLLGLDKARKAAEERILQENNTKLRAMLEGDAL